MSLNLVKGEKLALTKENAGLTVVKFGLGWKPATSGQAFDLDASAILLDVNSKVIEPFTENNNETVVFFGNLNLPGVSHSGDNLTGEGDGDDEIITVNLAQVDPRVHRIQFLVNIFQAESRRQNFGQVNDAYIRVFDDSKEYAKYDLTEDSSAKTGVFMGEIYRAGTEWKFGALGLPVDGDLNKIVGAFC